jgi:hypothetical protein
MIFDFIDVKSVVRNAEAIYIIADRGAHDAKKEDERNTLRVWAVDE